MATAMLTYHRVNCIYMCLTVLLRTPPRVVSLGYHPTGSTQTSKARPKVQSLSSVGPRPSVGASCSPMPTQGLRLGRGPARDILRQKRSGSTATGVHETGLKQRAAFPNRQAAYPIRQAQTCKRFETKRQRMRSKLGPTNASQASASRLCVGRAITAQARQRRSALTYGVKKPSSP